MVVVLNWLNCLTNCQEGSKARRFLIFEEFIGTAALFKGEGVEMGGF